MHGKIICPMIITCCVMMFGCSLNKTFVENENTSISRIENPQKALEPDLRFLGKVKGAGKAEWSSILRGAMLETESLIYGYVSSGNVVEKGLIVRTYKLYGENIDLIDGLFSKNSHIIDSGAVDIAGTKIPYETLSRKDVLDRDEKRLVSSKGLIMKDCYLVKDYRVDLNRLIKKSKSQVIFFDSSAGSECMDLTKKIRSKDTLPLAEFNRQADSRVAMLLEEKSASEDNASGRQTVVGSGADDGVSGTTELERKLTELKRLLDKGLITHGDYEKKKAELLESF